MATMGITSILYIRRSMYEHFLKLHQAISLGIIICLWLQRTRNLDFHTICLSIVTGIWSFEGLIWLGRMIYDRLRGVDKISIVPLQANEDSDVTIITIRCQRLRKITYGQYIYITIPSIPHSVVGRLQAHPYMVAWESRDGSGQTLTLIVAHRAGFSNMIKLCKNDTSMRVDGPYGGSKDLGHFDKVFFVASGVGLAAHLLAIRHLLQAHNDKTSRVRRLSLLWFLEKDGKPPTLHASRKRHMKILIVEKSKKFGPAIFFSSL